MRLAMVIPTLLLTALGLSMAAAITSSDEADVKVLASFQGDWRIDWIEQDGERIDLDDDAVYTIKNNVWLRGDRAISSIAIDAAYSPGLLDLTRLIDDARKGFKMEGIYKIDGDTMIWCCYTGEAAKSRPQEFRAPRGWDGTVYHMRRLKTAGK